MPAWNKKTPEEFIQQIECRPFTSTTKYKDNNTKLTFRCNVDGYIWNATPHNILAGSGCPQCSTRKRAKARRKYNKILSCENGTLVVDLSTTTQPSHTMQIDDIYQNLIHAFSKIFLDGHGYPVVRICGKTRKLHRLIMGLTNPQLDIDHINGNRTDNRRCNLRICTRSENLMNKMMQSNNTSGCTGVQTQTNGRTWFATITARGKTTHLGSFPTHTEAAHARKVAEIKYFGEFRYTEPTTPRGEDDARRDSED